MSNENDDYFDDIDDYYIDATFEGPCTCNHDMGEHGWEKCNVEGCNCEAHWEE